MLRTLNRNENNQQFIENNSRTVPIWEKAALTLQEAAAYSGIGENKLREITNEKGNDLVLWNGNKRLIKRKPLDRFIEHHFSL